MSKWVIIILMKKELKAQLQKTKAIMLAHTLGNPFNLSTVMKNLQKI